MKEIIIKSKLYYYKKKNIKITSIWPSWLEFEFFGGDLCGGFWLIWIFGSGCGWLFLAC